MRLLQRTGVLLSTIAVGLTVAGCGAAQQSAQTDPNSLTESVSIEGDYDPNAEFRWANSDGATSWDPIKSTTGFDMAFLMPVYDRLIYAAPDGTLEPMLAESWEESADGSTLTFKLRPDVTFTDGTPFTAEAVKINIDRALSTDSVLQSYISTISSVEVVDELTVTFTVSGAMGAVLTEMSARPGMMASPQAIAAGTLQTQPVGIGPYVATEIIPGASVTFEKTPDYWDPDAQRVAKMYFQQVADDQSRVNGVITGDFDGAVIRPHQVNVALKDDLTVVSGVSPTFSYLTLNTGIEPLGDPQVRLALNHAIDRKSLAEGLWDGYCTAQVQPFPETSFAYDTDIGDGLEEWNYDPEKAKEILTDAGYPDGFAMKIVAGNVTINTATAEAVQNQLAEIGVDVEIEVLSTAPLIEQFVVAKSAGGMVATAGATEDPHVVLQTYVLPTARFNPGGTLPADMTDLAGKAAAPLEGADRAPLYSQFMDRWMETPPNLIPLCMSRSLQAFSDDVMGVNSYASGVYDFRGMAMKEN